MPCYRVDVDIVHGMPDFSECRVARVIGLPGGARAFYVECSPATATTLSEHPGVVCVGERRDTDCAPDPSPS